MAFAKAGEQFEYIHIYISTVLFFLFKHQCGEALHTHSEMLEDYRITFL